MENEMLEIRMGALSPSITEQLESQSLGFDEERAAQFDMCKESIIHLACSGFMNDNERRSVEKKLFKAIEKHVKEQQE